MPPVTYESIATVTLANSTTAEVTFSSIPATYTDLVLVIGASQQSATTVKFQFNSDTGSNYSGTRLSGNGSAAASERASNQTTLAFSVGGTGSYNSIVHLMNYSNTTTNKTILSRSNDVGINFVATYAGLWRNTAAINTIKITTDNLSVTYFTSGSVLTLYGIKSA
jgi:hypothetical protein